MSAFPTPTEHDPELGAIIERASEGPRDVLAMQPEPIRARVSHFHLFGRVVSAIARDWRPGEARHCRLCPRHLCTASEDGCLVQVGRLVRSDEARLFSTIDLAPNRGFGGGLAPGDEAPRELDRRLVRIADRVMAREEF